MAVPLTTPTRSGSAETALEARHLQPLVLAAAFGEKARDMRRAS